MRRLKSPFWESVGIIGGMIIGSGMFALPYAVSVSGIWAGVLMGLLAFFWVLSLHLAYGEVVLNTVERHRLPGYVRLYLGKFAGNISKTSQLLTFNAALLVYGTLGGIFLNTIFGGGAFFWSIIFFLVAFVVLLLEGVEKIGLMNLFFIVLIGLVTIIISFMSFQHAALANLPQSGSDPFFAFGVFVFALTGISAIADAREIFKEVPRPKLKSAIVLATTFPFILYLVFVFAVLMASGPNVTKDAISGLVGVLGSRVVSLGALAGAAAMFSAYIALSYDIRKIYELDVGVKKQFALFLAAVVPFLIFLWGAADFIKIISIVGGVFVSIDGFMVLMILRKMRKLHLSQKKFLPFGFFQRFALLFILFCNFVYGLIYRV